MDEPRRESEPHEGDSAEKKVADAIEEAIGEPTNAEEAALLQAAEIEEVEFPDTD